MTLDERSEPGGMRGLGTAAFLFPLAGLILMAPWLLSGEAPRGHSYHLNAVWIEAFSASFASGEFYPRWLPQLWDGAGGADFFFYAPSPFWTSGLLKATVCAGCNADTLLVWTGTIWLIISGFSAYAFGRCFFSRWPAIAVGLSYMALPYHLAIDWADRQAVGEFAAMAIVPWHFAAAFACVKGKRGGIAQLSVATALILFSHLPTAIVVLFGYLAFVFAFWRSMSSPALYRLSVSGILGAGLSAVYWYPAVSLLNTVNSIALNLGSHRFLTLGFFSSDRGVAFSSALWPIFLILSAISVMLVIILRPSTDEARRFVLAVCGLCLFMVTPPSAPIWENTSLGVVQFPWRFLLLSDVAFALAVGILVAAVRAPMDSRRTGICIVFGAAFGLLLLTEHPSLRKWVTVVPDPQNSLAISAGAREWLPAELPNAYELGNDAKIAEVASVLTTIPEVSSEKAQSLSITPLTSRRARISSNLAEPDVITIKRTYWRFWELVDNETGQPINLALTSPFPLIRAELPAGESTLTLELPRLQAEKIGLAMTLASALVLLAFYTVGAVRRR